MQENVTSSLVLDIENLHQVKPTLDKDIKLSGKL